MLQLQSVVAVEVNELYTRTFKGGKPANVKQNGLIF